MAQVVLPFLGVQGWGKFGHAAIYTRWGSKTTVKPWKKPHDPKSPKQCRDRTYLMAASGFTSYVAISSLLAAQIREVCCPDVPWQAYFIGWMIGYWNHAIEESLTAWDTAGNQEAFNSVAGKMGLGDKKHPGAEIDPITGGEVVFIAARAAYRMELPIAPIDAQDMSFDQVDAFHESLGAGSGL